MMRLLIDEDTAVQIIEPLRHVLLGHEVADREYRSPAPFRDHRPAEESSLGILATVATRPSRPLPRLGVLAAVVSSRERQRRGAGVDVGGEEWIRLRPARVPNRLTAAASAHRSAAQNGQYWPPM